MNYRVQLEDVTIAEFTQLTDAQFFVQQARRDGRFKHVVTGRKIDARILDLDDKVVG